MASRVAKPKSFRLRDIVVRDDFQFNEDGGVYKIKSLNDFVTEDFADERHLVDRWKEIDERFRALDKHTDPEEGSESELTDDEIEAEALGIIGEAKTVLKELIRFRMYDDIPDDELDQLQVQDLVHTVDFLAEYRREQQVEARERRQEQQAETERTRQEASQPVPNRSRGRKPSKRKGRR